MAASSHVYSATAGTAAPETVVLLHGLGRTRWSMQRMADALEREGYRVVNLSYSSRDVPIETLAHEWLPQQLRDHGCDSAPRVHFVTHSMGGIIVRTWLRDTPSQENLGRVVMLAPPNAGSEVSDHLNAFPPFRWFTGVNGRRLGTHADSLPNTLGPWPAARPSSLVAVGIIAGDFSWNPLFSAWLPGDDDGKVSVASTHLAGERDHLVLPYSHTWLAWRKPTIAAVSHFLRHGAFPR